MRKEGYPRREKDVVRATIGINSLAPAIMASVRPDEMSLTGTGEARIWLKIGFPPWSGTLPLMFITVDVPMDGRPWEAKERIRAAALDAATARIGTMLSVPSPVMEDAWQKGLTDQERRRVLESCTADVESGSQDAKRLSGKALTELAHSVTEMAAHLGFAAEEVSEAILDGLAKDVLET